MFLRSFQLAHVMWPAWGYPAKASTAACPLPLVLRCLAQALATSFHRFLARFSGRRRLYRCHRKYPPPWAFLVLVLASSFSIADACSSRTTPKPRPPAPTPRPNITFHTYQCPPAYAAWYCLNGATCFTVKIGDSLLYNCECSEGYMGPRCEYKDLDGSYLPSQRRFMLETASIASGATIAVFLVVILCVAMYVHYKQRTKSTRQNGADCLDGPISPYQPTFGTRCRTQCLQQQTSTLIHHARIDVPSLLPESGDSKGASWGVFRQPSHHIQRPLERLHRQTNYDPQRCDEQPNRDVCSA